MFIRTPFNEYPHLAPAMPEIGDSVSTIMNLFTDNYSFVEDKNCYALLGLDYVLDSNRRPYLIEINDRPGLLPGDPATSHYSNKLRIAQDWLEMCWRAGVTAGLAASYTGKPENTVIILEKRPENRNRLPLPCNHHRKW